MDAEEGHPVCKENIKNHDTNDFYLNSDWMEMYYIPIDILDIVTTNFRNMHFFFAFIIARNVMSTKLYAAMNFSHGGKSGSEMVPGWERDISRLESLYD